MSTRANSLRNLVFDGLYFAAIMSAFGALTTTFAAGADPASERLLDVATDRRLTDDHIDSQLNTDDNMPSGDPTESAAEKRVTNILGMKLFEVRPGVTQVEDVTAASPAWDAGIRRGDQLLSIEGVKIRKLAPWVEDIARLLDDKQDGSAVTAQILRKDEPLDLRIKLPVSRAAKVRDARKEDLAIAEMARKRGQGAGQPQQPSQTIVARGEGERDYYGPGYVGGGGFVGGGVVDDGAPSDVNDDRMANRAVARLMAINTLGNGVRGEIGMATFQDSGSSVSASVAVRGLPHGSYVVGIDDGGAMAGGVGGVGPNGIGRDGIWYDGDYPAGYGDPNDPNWQGDGTRDPNGRAGREQNDINSRSDDRRMNDPRMQNPQNQQPMPAQPLPGQQRPIQGIPPQQTPQPQQPIGPAGPASGGTAPAGGASGGAPTGGDGASLANPNGASYLAQQLDPAMIRNNPNARQPNRVRSNANPTNPVTNNFGRTNNRADRNQNPNNGLSDPSSNPGIGGVGQPGGPQFMRDLGVLNIGPDGSGQLQTRLDGIRLRNLAGLSVTVASTASAGGNSIGANQNVDPRTNRTPHGRLAQSQQMNPTADPGVVATGVIQLVPGSGGIGAGVESDEPNYDEPLDPATERLRDRNFDASNPRQDFDPSNPRQDFDPSKNTTSPESQNFDPADQPRANSQ